MKKIIPLLFALMPLSQLWADSDSSLVDKAIAVCKSSNGDYTWASGEEKRGEQVCRKVTCRVKTSNDKDDHQVKPDDKNEANIEGTKEVCIDKKDLDKVWDNARDGKDKDKDGKDGDGKDGVKGGAGSAAGGAGAAAGGSPGLAGCMYLEGEGVIAPGELCFNECKPKKNGWFGLFGEEEQGLNREDCVRCLLKYPDVYKVKEKYLPKDINGKIIGDDRIRLGSGVSKAGSIVCRDAFGVVLSVEGATSCVPGSSVHNGGSGSGGVIVVRGDGNDRGRGRGRFDCSSSSSEDYCDDETVEIRNRGDRDCVNCAGHRQQSNLSGIAEIVGAIAPPLAHFGSSWLMADAQVKSNRAWANASVATAEQCRLGQQQYLAQLGIYQQYTMDNSTSAVTPEQQQGFLASMPQCNGVSLSGYAGMGTGMGNFYSGGYSPGYMSGMIGPYGPGTGYPGGGMAGMAGMAGGGMINGISLAGGYMQGGYMQGGYMQGGYMQGGYMQGGYMQGGYMQGGYMQGGYMQGGYMQGGYMQGGYMQGGYMQGGYNTGYNPGYAQGGWGSGVNGGMQGNYWGNTGGWGNAQADYSASMMASNQDRMFQQNGLGYQMGQTSGGFGNFGQTGYAAYHPANIGMSLGFGF